MAMRMNWNQWLSNKYVRYLVVALSVTNVMGYLFMRRLNAVILFALVGLIAHHFNKNWVVILLSALIVTNAAMATNTLEGLDNMNKQALNKIEDKDKDIADVIPAVQKAKNNDEVDAALSAQKKGGAGEKTLDMNNPDLNQVVDKDAPVGAGTSIGTKKNNAKSSESFAPRLDYAATIEQSYQHLDQMLGTDSIKQLSTDTQKLMKQQQNLFDTMQNMVPVLQGAQSLLKNFKIDGLADSLKSLKGVADAPLLVSHNGGV